jgi:hypothetical protein
MQGLYAAAAGALHASTVQWVVGPAVFTGDLHDLWRGTYMGAKDKQMLLLLTASFVRVLVQQTLLRSGKVLEVTLGV